MTPSQIALTLEIVAYMPVGITVVPLGCISDMKYKERVGKETRQNLVFFIVIKCPSYLPSSSSLKYSRKDKSWFVQGGQVLT